MANKNVPTALDYLILHHVSRAYIRSIENISKRNPEIEGITTEIYEESIFYLVNFMRTFSVSDNDLSDESKDVIRLIDRSMKIKNITENDPNYRKLIH